MIEALPTLVALSIRQPWAWLIVKGYKDIENRSWQTEFRGRFLIHASKTLDQAGYEWTRTRFSTIALPEISSLDTGGIIGSAELVDCVTSSTSPWFEGPYGFVIRDAQPLSFLKVPGKLSFFKVSI